MRDVHLQKDKVTFASKNFAFITFAHSLDADKCGHMPCGTAAWSTCQLAVIGTYRMLSGLCACTRSSCRPATFRQKSVSQPAVLCTEPHGSLVQCLLTPCSVSTRAYRALEAAEDSKLGPVLVSLANPLKQVLESRTQSESHFAACCGYTCC